MGGVQGCFTEVSGAWRVADAAAGGCGRVMPGGTIGEVAFSRRSVVTLNLTMANRCLADALSPRVRSLLGRDTFLQGPPTALVPI